MDEVQVDVDQARRRPRGRCQILSNSVAALIVWLLVGVGSSLSFVAARPRSRRAARASVVAGVVQVVGKVGVEGGAVARAERVDVAVDDQLDRARRGRRPSRGCRARGSAGRPAPPVAAPGREAVQGDVGALAGQRRGQLLDLVTAAAAAAAAARADDDDVARSRRGAAAGRGSARGRRRSGRRRPASGCSRRARPARASRRRRPERSARSRSDRPIPSRSALTRAPTAPGSRGGSARQSRGASRGRVRYHGRTFSIRSRVEPHARWTGTQSRTRQPA